MAGSVSAAAMPLGRRAHGVALSPDSPLAAMAGQFHQAVGDIIVLEGRKDQLMATASGLASDTPSTGYQSACKAWSAAVDHAESLAGQITAVSAQSLADLTLKFEALLWEISNDGPHEDSINKLQMWGGEFRRFAVVDHALPLIQEPDTHY